MESLSRAKLAYFRSLSMKKKRVETGLFIVEGTKMVNELLKSNLQVYAIVSTLEYDVQYISQWKVDTPLYVCSTAEFKQLSQLESPEGVLAIVQQREVLPSNEVPILYPSFWLNKIQDPGNLGTIIRTADWFGFRAIYCDNETVECYNPKVVRSTMGSLFRIPIYYFDNFVDIIRKESNSLCMATIDAQQTIQQITIQNPIGIVLGNESNGIEKNIQLIEEIQKISIGGEGQAESLNAAVAAGILAYWATQYQGNA